MAKYYGSVGFGETKEVTPGVHKMVYTERKVYGDVMKNARNLDANENLNDNISVSIRISFLADPYVRQNFHLIKYASYMGSLWKVKTVDEEFPRLVITLGVLFNE